MQPAQAGSSIFVHQKMMLELSTSGTAVCAATFCTNPIDVVKVRVQLASAGVDASSGLTGTCSSILRSEGMTEPKVTRYLNDAIIFCWIDGLLNLERFVTPPCVRKAGRFASATSATPHTACDSVSQAQ